MAIGFTTSSNFGSRAVVPDKGMSAPYKPRVLSAKFGDGYEQRLRDGINNVERTLTGSLKKSSLLIICKDCRSK